MKIGYSLAWRWATWRRRRYAARLPRICASRVPAGPAVPASLFFFSGTRDFPEQVASVRSFLRQVGEPRRIVVVGDGTHAAEHRALLKGVHPDIEVPSWSEFVRPDLPADVQAYARSHPLGKKVAVLMSLPAGEPVLFSDSDILYFGGGSELRERVSRGGPGAEFLMDTYPSLDGRLLVDESEKRDPVNSGFAILRAPLDWSLALERLPRMKGTGEHFSEQTLFHLAIHRSRGQALPRDRYIFESDDQWSGRDRHVGPRTVLRHYFSSLRYKMWLHASADRSGRPIP